MKGKKISIFDKVVMIALLLSPILQTYGWGKYNFASILTLCLAVIYLFDHNATQSKMPRKLCYFFAYWYFSHIVTNDFPISIIPIGIIRVVLIFMMFYDCFSLDYFVKKYRLFTLLFITIFGVQTLSRYAYGKVIPGVMSFLPISISNDAASLLSSLQDVERDCSIFSEPAIFVQFLLPILAMELLYFDRKSWWRIVLIVFTLLLLQSGNALLGLLVVGLFYMFSYYKGRLTMKKILGFSFLSLIVLIGSYYYINSEMGEKLMGRQDTIEYGAYEIGYVGSGFMRIYRGYFIYNDYSLEYKILGNDNVDYIKEVIKHSAWGWTFHDETYFNTFQSFLIYTGVVGTLLFGVFYVNQWKKTTYCGKAIMACYFALSFIALMHFNAMMAIYLLIPYALKRNDEPPHCKQIRQTLKN